ncbi:CHAT domain-containing protein [Kribbella sp. NPDC051936]|uniref:CHAT domain-containing protein n=1 Tax=Kribbella sp. NPDC051936 TaxID=3154946 RepID=UPI0034371A00
MQALLNFDLAIEARADGYRARVMASPAGEAEGSFELPFSDKDLQILVLKVIGSVGRRRRKLRRFESVERRMLEDFGGQLFEAVFSGSVRSCLERSLAAAEGEDAGLRIRLRLAPSLENVPWEYLYDRDYGFLCLSPETPLVRYVEIPRPVRPFPVRPPLRILAMIAAPTDVQALQNEDEWNKLNGSLGELIERGMVQLDRLPVGSLAALQRPLRRREYHVLHFVGHGLYDEDAEDGALVLEDESGQGRLVTGRDLGTMLRGHRSLRLVVLNACEGARSAVDDPFGGVAQALVRQGVPAVIAMQFEISDPVAVVFSQSFYQALADLLPADEAMVEARRAIFAADNEVEWATPVIYLRAPDGRIFAEVPVDEEKEQREREETERRERESGERREQEAAERRAREEDERRREEAERRQREVEERRERDRRVGEWNEVAAGAMREGRWDDAVGVLEQLVNAGQNDPATMQRLRSAQAQQRRAGLVAEARRLYSAGQWADVLTVAEQLDRLGATDKETARLTASAKSKLETAARKQAREQAQAAGRPVVADMRDRLFARLVDLGIYLIPLLLLTPRYAPETGEQISTGDTLRLGGIILAIATYEVVLTAIWGRTLGKRLLRLQVVRSDDRGPVGWSESLLRWFIQLLAWATCTFALVYLTPYWDKSGRRQGLHDRVAGTLVVKLPPR